MEYYQAIQNRTQETVAVIDENIPTLKVGGTDSAQLLAQANGLDGLAADRDEALVLFDGAVNAEAAGYALLQRLDIGLAGNAAGELDELLPDEAALESLLDPVFGVAPDTTEAAVERGTKLRAALLKIDPFLAEAEPPRGPITVGGLGVSDLSLALASQPGLEQAVETAAAAVKLGRSALRQAARALDRLNKRFYAKLKAEARENPTLAEALDQITTGGENLPATLGIRKILQGGSGGLQLLVSYDNASFDDQLTNTLEWQVVDVDADLSAHSTPVDPSGNALGPFAAGQQVKLRTRTRNASGTTTGSVRTLTIQAPAL